MSRSIIGREDELGSIQAFLELVGHRPAALVIDGEPGIGKTALWQSGVERARAQFRRVLLHRAVEAEGTLSFSALSELLGEVLDEGLPSLAAPRRRALEIALLLEEPGEEVPEARAIALAFLDVLRTLAQSGPVLVAIDDLQWLDAPTAGVLEFALRRLRDEHVGFMATSRVAPDARAAFDLQRSLAEGMLERLPLGPLSVGALYHLLKERLGLDLSRPELTRLQEVTGGNPFFLLELGRELVRTKRRLVPGQPLPVPGNLKELIGQRLARLPDWTRDALLPAAALARPTVDAVALAHGDRNQAWKALELAARAGVVELENSRIRFAHPLLASVCYEEAPVWRRRAAHRRLAEAVAEDEERARHLALAADGPNAAVASDLDRAAEQAAGRGATATAAELLELGAELTLPKDEEERRRRRLRAAKWHRLAGNRERAGVILEELLPEVPSGAERADVLFALASGRQVELPRITELCEEALVEAADDDGRAGEIMAFLSWIRLPEGDVRGALRDARCALKKAEQVKDPVLLARAIARVAMAETWSLDITPGLVERGVAIEERLVRPFEYHESPTVALARRLICLGDLRRARALLEEAETKAAARGDEGTRGHLLFSLIMLEWFAGDWKRALRHAAAALELSELLGDQQYKGMVLHAQALVDAHLGRAESARAAFEEADAIAVAVSDAISPIWNLAALGHLELSLGNLDVAARHLRALPARLVSLDWNDPADPVWPDTIEVLIGIGELEQARAYLDQYEEQAERLGSAWALACAARCRGLLLGAKGDFGPAFEAFEGALAEHKRVESPFELARTLLALGLVRRRSKQKRAAREVLEQARAAFEEMGATSWAERARGELARIGGRRPATKELTETEERVASLAARGRSNKEIASELYMSVHTVEAHLSRVYRKLGVRSRAELAGRRPGSGGAAVKV